MTTSIMSNLRILSSTGTFLDFTTVWNHHSIKSWSTLIQNKNSNLFGMLNSVLSVNDKKNGITIAMGASGRNQHSASEVIAFKGDQSEKLSGVYFSRKELTKMGVK